MNPIKKPCTLPTCFVEDETLQLLVEQAGVFDPPLGLRVYHRCHRDVYTSIRGLFYGYD